MTPGIKEALKSLAAVAAFVLVLSAYFWLTSCAYWHEHPTEVRVFVASDIRQSPIGAEPTGNVLITQPLPWYMEASYNHVSSVPLAHGERVIDQFGIGVCVKIPLKRCE